MITEAKVLSLIVDATTGAALLLNSAQKASRILAAKRAEGRDHFTAEEQAQLADANAAADAEFAAVLAQKQSAGG